MQYLLNTVFCLLTFSLSAQSPHLDVEGHGKIRGNFDISHMDDTTSMFMGVNTGKNMTFGFTRWNTFVGSENWSQQQQR